MRTHRHNTVHRRFLRRDDGSITVEFVITYPLILAALAFAFEFGRMFIAHHMLVNNVRSAERYLARSDLSTGRISEAEEIIRTGAPSGGDMPKWATSIDVVITPAQATFTDVNFREGSQVIRIDATMNFQPLIASFFGGANGTIPIAVIEDIRHVGE